MSDTDNTPEKKRKTEGKLVSISCRATSGCAGTQAMMKIIKQNNVPGIAGGGRTIRYTCKTCSKPYVIST